MGQLLQNGITTINGALPGGTQGSVLFIGPSSTIAQDNAQFFWDDTNHRLLIGTNTTLGADLVISPALAQDKIWVANSGSGPTGIGVTASIMQIFANNAKNVAFGNKNAALTFTEVCRVTATGFVVGSTGSTASVGLELISTTQAFAPPRMTTTQKNAIATPSAGMVVYDTTLNKLSVYTGAAWETVTSV